MKWKIAKNSLQHSVAKLDSLKSELDKASDLVTLQRGNSHLKIKAEDIGLVKSEYGPVRVYLADHDTTLFSGTINGLFELLPKHSFFHAARNAVHREAISSVTSISYGKIEIKDKEGS